MKEKGKKDITIKGADNGQNAQSNGKQDGCIGCGCLVVIIAIVVIIALFAFGGSSDDDSDTPTYHKASKKAIAAYYKAATGNTATHVEYYKDSGFALVEYKDKQDIITDTEFVSRHVTEYINLCRKAYKLKGLKNITYTVSTKMEDNKGNTSYDDVFSCQMKKSVFDTYHWSKLESHTNAIADAVNGGDFDKWYLHPSINSGVKWDEVFYDGADKE
jgi:hypothetical protein